MPSRKHPFPSFLNGVVTEHAYGRWLARKAAAHVKRDRKRSASVIMIEDYKTRIHAAVTPSAGLDAYTGETLDWHLISTFDNSAAKAGRTVYKSTFARLPTVDHVAIGIGWDFVICGWATNDAKGDLSLREFLDKCRQVLRWAERVPPSAEAVE